MLQGMLDGEIQPCSIGASLTARYYPLDDHLLHRLSTISSGPTSLFGIQHLRLDPVFPPVRHRLHQSEKASRCITRNQIGIKPVIQQNHTKEFAIGGGPVREVKQILPVLLTQPASVLCAR